MTIREYISNVRKGLKEVGADSTLPNKLIYSRGVSKVGLIIQRESDALRLDGAWDLYQVLKCVEVEEIPAIDPKCNISNMKKLFRTKRCLPDLYHDNDGPILRSIRSIDTTTEITLTTLTLIQRGLKDTNARFDKTVYAFYSENHLYLTKKTPVRIEGAFVEDVSRIDCYCDTIPCYSFLDTEWRCPKRLQDQIISLVIQDIAGIYERIPTKPLTDKNENT